VSLLVWVIDIVYVYYIIGYVVVLFYVLLSYCVLYILYLDIITGLLLTVWVVAGLLEDVDCRCLLFYIFLLLWWCNLLC